MNEVFLDIVSLVAGVLFLVSAIYLVLLSKVRADATMQMANLLLGMAAALVGSEARSGHIYVAVFVSALLVIAFVLARENWPTIRRATPAIWRDVNDND